MTADLYPDYSVVLPFLWLLLQGYYTKPNRPAHQRAEQVICQPGRYCMAGVMTDCPPGVYGNASGLAAPTCTAPCPVGACFLLVFFVLCCSRVIPATFHDGE